MSKFMTMKDLANRIQNERPDILDHMESTQDEHELSVKLLERRKTLKISQEELKERAKLTQSQISNMENGAIKSFANFRKMLNALDLDIKLVPKCNKPTVKVLGLSAKRTTSRKKQPSHTEIAAVKHR